MKSMTPHRPLVAMLLSSLVLACQTVDSSTLKGKVLLGYQGWFRCPGGGTMGTNWSHWSNGVPTPGSLVIDMYPDLREFDADELCAVPNMTLGGKPAYLFSSGNSKTVARHFRWMRQYGLDGVLVQRFLTDIPGNRAAGDVVLKNVMSAAANYGRVFAIEYDVSGANPATVATVLQQDWDYLVNTLKVTEQPNYLRHDGKPVLSIWGIGFTDNHPPADPAAARQIVQWFQARGVTYMGGTPSYWRALSNDARTDPAWAGVYESMDVIQPWTVGRYNNTAGIDRWRVNQIQPDMVRTAQNGQLYMPVIFPGFSWYNLRQTGQGAPQNQIPRTKGEFLWRQFYNARAAGADMLKIAMFDEVNEATAMFKIASRRQDAPEQGYWLTLDADGFLLPSDWYLRLAGEITRVFHGESPLNSTMPEKPGPPWSTDQAKVASAASPDGAAIAPESLATISGPMLLAEPELTVLDSSGLAQPARVLAASPERINFQVPPSTATGTAAFLVTGGAIGAATVAPVSPGLFSADMSGQGVAEAAVTILHPDGTTSSSLTFSCPSAGACEARPIDLGGDGALALLELYGTGLRGRSSLNNVNCTIGGIDAPVQYAGPQASFPGLDQVNVILPRALAGAGIVPILLNVDGKTANTVTVNIR